MDYSGRFEAAGEQATVLCPPETRTSGLLVRSRSSGSGDSYLLSETRIYNDADQWVGISFTAPEPGFYRGSLDFQWRPFVSIMACSAVLPPGRTEPVPAGAFPWQL